MDLTNTKLVTHANCPDGLACAIVFISAGGQRNNVVFSSPNHKFVDEKVKDLLGSSSGVDIIIADLSVSEQLAEVIENAYKNVLLFDHHNSAEKIKKLEDIENPFFPFPI
jgi:oligoribonuclease NrnB/cAMP/cGMP phosphodiesterase (DHH superfamily)